VSGRIFFSQRTRVVVSEVFSGDGDVAVVAVSDVEEEKQNSAEKWKR